ncbi:MAG: XRE family transcriptional regulator [Proteobacteria bacterium]|nr:MAG: XRE family transcriptional regulator [Pseudomonadota bacterium]
MKQDLHRELVAIVKARAKTNGLTQAALAKRLSVSLPTMKRWYQGDFVTLENLKRLCDEVGLSLTEAFATVEDAKSLNFQYTNEQEVFFAMNLDCEKLG